MSDPRPERKIEIDPAVADLLQQGKRRQEERSLSVDERKKLAKQRTKESKRTRKIFDLPEDVIQRIEQIAQKYGCPESQVAAFLLTHGLQELDDESIDLEPYLTPSRSPRYKFNLQTPESDQ